LPQRPIAGTILRHPEQGGYCAAARVMRQRGSRQNMARSPLMHLVQRIARDAFARADAAPDASHASRRDFLRRGGALALAGAASAWTPVAHASSSSARDSLVSPRRTSSPKPT
jgi:hypothetical protein